MEDDFDVKNIKCGGCIDSIRKGLSELENVTTVSATLEGEVHVEGEALDREVLAAKLAELGFPEA